RGPRDGSDRSSRRYVSPAPRDGLRPRSPSNGPRKVVHRVDPKRDGASSPDGHHYRRMATKPGEGVREIKKTSPREDRTTFILARTSAPFYCVGVTHLSSLRGA